MEFYLIDLIIELVNLMTESLAIDVSHLQAPTLVRINASMLLPLDSIKTQQTTRFDQCPLPLVLLFHYTNISTSYNKPYFETMQDFNPSQALASANLSAGSSQLSQQPHCHLHSLQFHFPCHFARRAPPTFSIPCFLVESVDKGCNSSWIP